MNEKIASSAYKLLMILWCLWALFSTYLLLLSDIKLIIWYSIYIIISTVILAYSRRDIFHPASLFTILCFQAFALSIPFVSNQGFQFLGRINDGTLTKVVQVLLVTKLGFVAGSYISLSKYIPLHRVVAVGKRSIKVTSFHVFMGMLIVLGAGIIRIKFHLGEAGVQPTIRYAGIFQYALYQGVLVMGCWVLAQGLRQSSKFTLIGLILLVGVAAVQVKLGWRGGIVNVAILIGFIFWHTSLLYARKSATVASLNKKTKKRSRSLKQQRKNPKIIVWLIILAVLVPVFIKKANRIRADKLGGAHEFSEGVSGFVEKFLTRAQGTTRLAVVVAMKSQLTLTNDFFIITLAKQGVSTTEYVDTKVYGIKKSQSHSIGTSGPGGPYVAAGILGVFLAYMLLGLWCRGVYDVMRRKSDNFPLSIVWYAFVSHALFGVLAENFNVTTIKLLFSISVFVFSIGWILRSNQRSVSSRNTTIRKKKVLE